MDGAAAEPNRPASVDEQRYSGRREPFRRPCGGSDRDLECSDTEGAADKQGVRGGVLGHRDEQETAEGWMIEFDEMGVPNASPGTTETMSAS